MPAVSTNRFQAEHGSPAESVVGKVRDHMHPWVQEFICHAPFAVVASADAAGNCDASPKGGTPGFVKVLDEHHLLVPDVKGNNLFQSYENVDSNSHVGLIFFIPGVNQTVRVNGRAEVVSRGELESRGLQLEVFDPDENAGLRQGLLVAVDEAFGHCPRAVNFSRLWDTDLIAHHQQERPISPRPKGV